MANRTLVERLEDVRAVQTIGGTIVLYRPEPDEGPARPTPSER